MMRNFNTRPSKEAGFTLIEVLIAFAILAGVVASTLALLSQNARFMVAAQDRLMAEIAADNLMVQELATATSLSTGETTGAVTVAGRSFDFQRVVLDASENVVQIEYVIRRTGGTQPLARVAALKAQ